MYVIHHIRSWSAFTLGYIGYWLNMEYCWEKFPSTLAQTVGHIHSGTHSGAEKTRAFSPFHKLISVMM